MCFKVQNERVYYRFEEIDDEGALESVQLPDDFPGAGDDTQTLPNPKKGFWRRQFAPTVTRMQRRVDWYLGVMLPLACFYFDPGVFRSQFGSALLHDFQPFAYAISSVSIMAMVTWLLWGERLKWLGAFLAGLFFSAAAVSFVVGMILLPFSLIGILFLIGLLGFTPLLTAVVFLRNGVRALRSSSQLIERPVLIHIIALTSLLSLVIPYVIGAAFK